MLALKVITTLFILFICFCLFVCLLSMEHFIYIDRISGLSAWNNIFAITQFVRTFTIFLECNSWCQPSFFPPVLPSFPSSHYFIRLRQALRFSFTPFSLSRVRTMISTNTRMYLYLFLYIYRFAYSSSSYVIVSYLYNMHDTSSLIHHSSSS